MSEPSDHVTHALEGFASGSLPVDDAREVSAHLKGCPSCRQALRAVRRRQVARRVFRIFWVIAALAA